MSKHTHLDDSAMPDLPSMHDFKVAIISTAWNRQVLSKLEQGALEKLREHHMSTEHIHLSIVPGAFELVFAAKKIKSEGKYDAIICLGCIIKGETPHDVYICNAVSSGIMQLNLDSEAPHIPVIFGVLTTNNELQALERAGGKVGNKGSEAALAALHMIRFNQPI
jgi:6,7-dimethyl-8-ribityllumazine synthase